MSHDKEFHRSLTQTEFRSEDKEGKRMLAGYAAKFNSRSENLGWFREILMPKAFRYVLANKPDTRYLYNHNPDSVLGRTTNGTLRLKEDEVGLYTEVELPDTTLARDLMEMIKRGDVNQMSFWFQMFPGRAKWTTENEEYVRILQPDSISRLLDVSVVTFPAYTTTNVSVRKGVLSDDMDFAGVQEVLDKAEQRAKLDQDDFKKLDHAIELLQLLRGLKEATSQKPPEEPVYGRSIAEAREMLRDLAG